MLVGALEGEMLVARAYGDPARFIAAAELLVAQLDGGRRTRPRQPARPCGGRCVAAARRARGAAGRPPRLGFSPLMHWLTPLFVLALIAGTASSCGCRRARRARWRGTGPKCPRRL